MRKLFIFIFLAAAFTLTFSNNSVSAAYDGGNLIDNSTFLNSTSMTRQGIQSFLESKGGGIANRSFLFDCASTGSASSRYYQQAGAPCGQNASAATIIYYAAQIYGVNPQVVLATLQKEQSLITTANPTSWQINQAMGYGCPDNGGCGASDFLYQIDNGVWTLRVSMERARGNMSWWSQSSSWVCGTPKNYYKPNLYPNQNVNFYDDAGYMYRTHYIMNAATSSFYCYTPHAYNNPQGLYGLPAYGTGGGYYTGSYNFVSFFERWFGSTRGGQSSLIKGDSSGTVYLNYNGVKQIIPSMSLLQDYGFDPNSILSLPQSIIDNIPYPSPESAISQEIGYVIKSNSDTDSDGGAAYLVSRGVRYGIQSMTQFNNFGFSEANIKYVSYDLLSNLRDGGILHDYVQMPDGAILKVQSSTKALFLDYQAFIATNPSGVFASISEGSSAHLRTANPITSREVFLKNEAGSAVYAYNSGVYALVPNMETFGCLGIGQTGRGLVVIPASRFPDTTPSTVNLSCIMKDTQGVKMYSSNTIYSVPNSYNINTLTVLPEQLLGLNATYTNTQELKDYIQGENSAAIWRIVDGSRQAIPSLSNYKLMNYPSFSVINEGSLSLLPENGLAFGTGQIVKSNSSPAVYVIDGTSRFTIPNEEVFSAARFKWQDLETYPEDALSKYPVRGVLESHVIDGSSRLHILGTTKCYGISTADKDAFTSRTTPSDYSGGIFSNIKLSSCAPGSRYVKTDNSAIVYFIEAETKRPITSWRALTNHAKVNDPEIMSVTESFLRAYPQGSAID